MKKPSLQINGKESSCAYKLIKILSKDAWSKVSSY